MRVRALLALAVLVSVAACEGAVARSATSDSIPPAVNCGDAAQFRRRAADDERRVEASRSDHERISVGSRANFFASLAVIANLKCKVTLPEADEALKPALAAATKAAATNSVYEKTKAFNDANFLATRVIELMTARLGASSK